MGLSPENNSPIFLSQQNIEHKFDELEMPKYLQDTCKLRKIKQTVDKKGVTSCLPIIQPSRHTGWRGESFHSKITDEPQAVVYWRMKADGDEERQVPWFIAPDGAYYVVDHVKHPRPKGEPTHED